MSQTTIYDIIKSADKPMLADEIIKTIKDKGEYINKQSFYTNMSKIEQDEHIGFEIMTFHRKKWFYSKTPLKKRISLNFKKIRRFSNQVGLKPRYPSNNEEHMLKLVREADIIKSEFEHFRGIRDDLKVSIAAWQEAAKKYDNLETFKEDLEITKLELK